MADATSKAGTLPVICITRPEPQAGTWVDMVHERVHKRARVIALPLIEIGPADKGYQPALQQATQRLADYSAVFFVSIPAVTYFIDSLDGGAAHWNRLQIRAWAPGRGTRKALLQRGIQDHLIDSPPPAAAQFDSETLWPLISPQMPAIHRAGRKVLRVRGADGPATDMAGQGDGRDWLATRVREAGLVLDTVVAYQRRPPVWNVAAAAQVRAMVGHGRSLWVCSSSQALQNLQHLLPQQGWQGAAALATHPRIAATAVAAGFGEVLTSRPDLDEVVQSIESWL